MIYDLYDINFPRKSENSKKRRFFIEVFWKFIRKLTLDVSSQTDSYGIFYTKKGEYFSFSDVVASAVTSWFGDAITFAFVNLLPDLDYSRLPNKRTPLNKHTSFLVSIYMKVKYYGKMYPLK